MGKHRLSGNGQIINKHSTERPQLVGDHKFLRVSRIKIKTKVSVLLFSSRKIVQLPKDYVDQ